MATKRGGGGRRTSRRSTRSTGPDLSHIFREHSGRFVAMTPGGVVIHVADDPYVLYEEMGDRYIAGETIVWFVPEQRRIRKGAPQ